MTEIETERPTPRGSRFLGILGAFLGALAGAMLSDLLLLFLPDDVGKVALLLGVMLAGWTACWGYRLFRGYQNMRFAQWTVRVALALAQPLALAGAIIGQILWQLRATGMALQAEILETVLRHTGAFLLERDTLGAIGWLVLLDLFFVRLSWGGLLKYVDPAWYSDPRRLARTGGGGATFNMPPCWPLPKADALPTSFEVDKGKLTVEGSTLTYKAWAKPRRSFSVGEIAGVVLGVGSGYNILFDRDNRELARFAWSRKNALLFGQYLIAHDIPFIDPNGQPVETRGQKVSLPRQFEVREGKACLVVGVACLVVFGILALLCLLVLDELAIPIALAVFLFFILMGVWMLLSYKNRRMAVEGDTLTYTTAFGRTTQFRVSEVGSLRFRFGLGTREIRDREGRLLARFEDNMKGAALLVEYLNQHMTPAEGQ